MLDLFGLLTWTGCWRAYQEVAPLADGWRAQGPAASAAPAAGARLPVRRRLRDATLAAARAALAARDLDSRV